TERAGFKDDAVTRNDERDRIGAHGGADGARRLRLADYFREPAVGCERSRWNSQKRTPDAHLKRRAAGKRAEKAGRCGLAFVSENWRCQLCEPRVVAIQSCVRPLRRKNFTGAGPPFAVDEREMTDSALCFSDERFAKRCFGKSVIDLHSGSAIFHFTRRRGFERNAKIMQTSRSGQSGVERSVEDSATVQQKLFHVLEC